MKNKAYFVILDQSLKDGRGHHYELASNLSKGAIDIGFKVLWLTHSEFPNCRTPFEVKIERIFSNTMYDNYMLKASNTKNTEKQPACTEISNKISWKLNRYKELLALILTRYFGRYYLCTNKKPTGPKNPEKSLLHVINDYSLGTDDHILIHTADGSTYECIRDLLVGKNIHHLPNIHIATPYDMKTMPNQTPNNTVPKMIRHLKQTGLLDTKVFLYGENKPLSDNISKWVNQKVTPLNLPPPDIKYIDNKTEQNTLNIVYVGAARIEKGFLLLPEIIQSLWDNYGKNKIIKFTIQCSPQIIGYLPVITSAIEKLKAFPKYYVQLCENQQSTEEYYQMLSNADIVLLCYEKEKYHVRGSGIAVESVSMGKIIVTTTDTFPAYLAEDSAATGKETNEYIAAIIDIANNSDKYRKAAKRVSSYYRKTYSNTSYIKTLIGNSSQKVQSDNSRPEYNYSNRRLEDITASGKNCVRRDIDTLSKLVAIRKGECFSEKDHYTLPLLLQHINYDISVERAGTSLQSSSKRKATEHIS